MFDDFAAREATKRYSWQRMVARAMNVGKTSVTVTFPNAEIARAWMGYMSDGGGEYGFMETDAGQNTIFDYDFDQMQIEVSEVG
jgi:hypothetical protein